MKRPYKRRKTTLLHNFVLKTEDGIILLATAAILSFFASSGDLVEVLHVENETETGNTTFPYIRLLDFTSAVYFVALMFGVVVTRVVRTSRGDRFVLMICFVVQVILHQTSEFFYQSNTALVMNFTVIPFVFTGLDFRFLFCLSFIKNFISISFLVARNTITYSSTPLWLNIAVCVADYLPLLCIGPLVYFRLYVVAKISNLFHSDPLKLVIHIAEWHQIFANESNEERLFQAPYYESSLPKRLPNVKNASTNEVVTERTQSDPFDSNGWLRMDETKERNAIASKQQQTGGPSPSSSLVRHKRKETLHPSRKPPSSLFFSSILTRAIRPVRLLLSWPTQARRLFEKMAWGRGEPQGPETHWWTLGPRYGDPTVDAWYRTWAAAFHEMTFINTNGLDLMFFLVEILRRLGVLGVQIFLYGDSFQNIIPELIVLSGLTLFIIVLFVMRGFLSFARGSRVVYHYVLIGLQFGLLMSVLLWTNIRHLTAFKRIYMDDYSGDISGWKATFEFQRIETVLLYLSLAVPLRSSGLTFLQILVFSLHLASLVTSIHYNVMLFLILCINDALLSQAMFARPQDKNRRNIFARFVLPILKLYPVSS